MATRRDAWRALAREVQLENEPFDKSGPEDWWLGRPYCLKLKALIHEVCGTTMEVPSEEAPWFPAASAGAASASKATSSASPAIPTPEAAAGTREAGGGSKGLVTVQRLLMVNLWSDWQLFGSKRVGARHFSLENAIACADIVGLDVYEVHGADPQVRRERGGGGVRAS